MAGPRNVQRHYCVEPRARVAVMLTRAGGGQRFDTAGFDADLLCLQRLKPSSSQAANGRGAKCYLHAVFVLDIDPQAKAC